MLYKVIMRRSTLMVVCTEVEEVEGILPAINKEFPSGGEWRVNQTFGPSRCSCKGGKGTHWVLVPRMIRSEK
jgi:hypothetical protein